VESLEFERQEILRQYDQMDKLVHDRDRQARGFERQIKHFEDETRRLRMEAKETQQKLNEMEGLKLNVEKEKEQCLIENKSVHARLETQMNLSEQLRL